MPKFTFVTEVECANAKEASRAMTERLGHDEDYGFDYQLEWVGPDSGLPGDDGPPFSLDEGTFRDHVVANELDVPAHDDDFTGHPAADVLSLLYAAREAGALSEPAGLEVDAFTVDEIDDSGFIVVVRMLGKPSLYLTTGWTNWNDFQLAHTDKLEDADRAVHFIGQIVAEANAALVRS